jgi:hypothetical protein
VRDRAKRAERSAVETAAHAPTAAIAGPFTRRGTLFASPATAPNTRKGHSDGVAAGRSHHAEAALRRRRDPRAPTTRIRNRNEPRSLVWACTFLSATAAFDRRASGPTVGSATALRWAGAYSSNVRPRRVTPVERSSPAADGLARGPSLVRAADWPLRRDTFVTVDVRAKRGVLDVPPERLASDCTVAGSANTTRGFSPPRKPYMLCDLAVYMRLAVS